MELWSEWGFYLGAFLVGSVIGTWLKRARRRRQSAREDAAWEEQPW